MKREHFLVLNLPIFLQPINANPLRGPSSSGLGSKLKVFRGEHYCHLASDKTWTDCD